MIKIGILLANGFEETECIVPIDMLSRTRKIEVIKIGVCDIQDSCIKIREGVYKVLGSHQIDVILDTSLQNAMLLTEENIDKTSDFDAFMLPGGMQGAENLSKSHLVEKLLLNAYKNKKLIAAICASPAVVLGKFGIISSAKKSKAICYPGCEKLSGMKESDYSTIYSCKGSVAPGVVVDKENCVITAQAAGSAFEFGFAISEYLLDASLTKGVADSIYYKYR